MTCTRCLSSNGKFAPEALSFIKSPFGPGLPVGDPRGARGTTLGPRTGIYLEFRTHHNVREKVDRVARPETVRDRHLSCRCPSVPVMQTANALLCPGGANYIRLRFGRSSAGVSLFSPI